MKAILLFALLFQAAAPASAAQGPAPAETKLSGQAAGLRDTLLRLVKQDEELDAVLAKLEEPKKLSAHDLRAAGLTLNLVAGDLDSVSALNKGAFAAVKPGSGVEGYTNAILSYSRKLEKKAARTGLLAARLAKGAGLRDALAARSKRGKKAGRNLARLLEDQDAAKALAADAGRLNASARGLSATSRWLDLAAK